MESIFMTLLDNTFLDMKTKMQVKKRKWTPYN